MTPETEKLFDQMKSGATGSFCREDDPRMRHFVELKEAGLIKCTGTVLGGSWGGDDNSGRFFEVASPEPASFNKFDGTGRIIALGI